jgi:hypothetical protein
LGTYSDNELNKKRFERFVLIEKSEPEKIKKTEEDLVI